VESRLGDIGEVNEVSVLPLMERLTRAAPLPGCSAVSRGVSYLVRAGGTRLLFDTGLSGGRGPLGLFANAERLGVDLSALNAVVISHLHETMSAGFAR
jgi:metal-dependent hydrolase (beta-lactamase superfamily II)